MQVRYVPMMSSAVAVALNFMAYRSDTSTVQPWAVKASLAASLAAALNEPALWWAYTINTFFPAKYKNNQIKTWPHIRLQGNSNQGLKDTHPYWS